jgi:hypothetical protein
MAIAVNLIAPAGIVSTNITGISGAAYAVDANGFVTVTGQGDVVALLNAGYRYAAVPLASSPIGVTGLIATSLRLLDAASPAGGPLAAAPSAGVLGYHISLGSAFALLSETANANAKTDSCLLEFMLPSSYVAGQNLNVAINTTVNLGSGVLSAKSVFLNAYRTDKTGVQGLNLTVAPSIAIASNAATDNAFVVGGATLNPGDRLVLNPGLSLTETAGQNVSATINSIRIS